MKNKRFYTNHYILLLLAFFLFFGCLNSVSHAKIVFSSKRNGDTHYHIYVMDDNGSNVRKITDSAFYNINPRWFPDGKKILFARDLTNGSNKLNLVFYITDLNNFDQYSFMNNHPSDRFPTLSPDGKQVAFFSKRAGEWDIYTYQLDNNSLTQLTENLDKDAWSRSMDWSPDGKKIAYEHDSALDGDNIWIMNANGTRKRRFSPADEGNLTILNRGPPSWSPSGKYIMYYEEKWNVGNGDLNNWVKIAEKLIIQNVNTKIREEHFFPLKSLVISGCWMGDDRYVLLPIKMNSDAPDANYEIYRYDLWNRKLKNLTKQLGGDYDPHWIEGSLSVFPLDKLTIRWAQLKNTD